MFIVEISVVLTPVALRRLCSPFVFTPVTMSKTQKQVDVQPPAELQMLYVADTAAVRTFRP